MAKKKDYYVRKNKVFRAVDGKEIGRKKRDHWEGESEDGCVIVAKSPESLRSLQRADSPIHF